VFEEVFEGVGEEVAEEEEEEGAEAIRAVCSALLPHLSLC
jgi:hypothetical protein